MRSILSYVLAALVSAGASLAPGQTGPAPEAADKKMETTATITPKQLVDGAAAAAIWNLKAKDKETTSALHARARKQLQAMLARDPKKLDYDTDFWRLLTYLREVPWEKIPSSRQTWYLQKMPNRRLTEKQRNEWVKKLEKKPLYKMSPKEIDVYLGWMKNEEPNLRKRIVRLARQNLGQPYQIYLLGEFPYEVYDGDPMYCLDKGDCVVFSEHIYGMALSSNWKEFFANLQRLRYKDGKPGMTTRNHFTEADWDKNNTWLLEDATETLGSTTTTQYTEKIDRAAFFRNFGIGQDIPVEMLEDTYIPAEAVPSVLDKLEDGDFVNVVRGRGKGVWVGHVGLIARGKDGTVNFIHSTEPKSKEQSIMEYVNDNLKKNVKRAKEGKAEFLGFKFLKLKDEADIPATVLDE